VGEKGKWEQKKEINKKKVVWVGMALKKIMYKRRGAVGIKAKPKEQEEGIEREAFVLKCKV